MHRITGVGEVLFLERATLDASAGGALLPERTTPEASSGGAAPALARLVPSRERGTSSGGAAPALARMVPSRERGRERWERGRERALFVPLPTSSPSSGSMSGKSEWDGRRWEASGLGGLVAGGRECRNNRPRNDLPNSWEGS